MFDLTGLSFQSVYLYFSSMYLHICKHYSSRLPKVTFVFVLLIYVMENVMHGTV